MIPPSLLDGGDGLVILDWSGWVHASWHRVGPEGLLRDVASDLLQLLAEPSPPRLVRAVDSRGPTHRHAMTEHLDPQARYKANRGPKPWDFYALAGRLDALVDELQIPTLWPANFGEQTWEADDAAATACARARARAAGLPVVLLSRDKDWRQLVTDDAPRVQWWDGRDKVLDRAGVIEAHGVPPELLGDWLALVGDTSDNIPGVAGLGPKGATTLLKAWPGVAALLAEQPLGAEQLAAMAAELKTIRRSRDKARKAFEDASAFEAEAARLAFALDTWKLLAQAHAQRPAVELSRRLVELRADCPIELDLDAARVGGWSVDRVRRVLQDLGIGYLGRDLVARKKTTNGPREARREANDGRPERASGTHDPGSEGPAASGREGLSGAGAAARDGSGGDLRGPGERAAEGAQGPREELTGPLCGALHSDGVTTCERLAEHVHGATPGDRAHIGGGRSWITRERPTDEQRARTETAIARGAVERATYPIAVRDTLAELLDPKHLPACDPAVRAELIATLRGRPAAPTIRRGAA